MATSTHTDLFALPQEFLDLRDMIRQIATEKIAPRAHDIDANAEYPHDLREILAENGILGLPFDEEYGGTGTGILMLNIGVEEIAKACAATSLILMVQELGSMPIKLFGSEEQKQEWLPRLASGEITPAFALSEPEAGSDPASMRTHAYRDGDEWVINGAKNWITNSGIADYYLTFAVTDREAGKVSAFIVEKDRPGFSIGKLEKKLGIKGSPTGSPVYEDVRVPHANLVGEEGKGMAVALKTLSYTRLGAAAQATGIAQGATDYAAKYASERIQFGKPINRHQGIAFKLADMQAKTAAARAITYEACAKADRGDADYQVHGSMAKLIASDTAMAVTVEAVQVLGGYGYVTEYPVERMMRDAKITQIYEGTSEVQRMIISRSLS
ncbi:acyl-CoA dehydrogenase family protein [Svornostia abyssi]|uniref:Acyl-CoA dehydrogenase family protein n=1 Tax=Svornostia abyssi TaxID=2898438 RepID=A0ABY5PHG8_9ACTN|nr:acyl-CoA dehydrogenase family protein [Parviterribacteraceae bacterium J379]